MRCPMSDEPERDPVDAADDLYSALAVSLDGWTLRDSQTGEEHPVSRAQLAQFLADCRRMRATEGPEYAPD
jgi:hypothetical protein